MLLAGCSGPLASGPALISTAAAPIPAAVAPTTVLPDPAATSATTIGAASPPAPAPAADFTLVILPDTQVYSAVYPETFAAQTQWIVDHRAERNIVFVIQVGDLVDGSGEARQWERADAAVSLLDGHVPYGIAPGNHDLGPGGRAAFEARFGAARYEAEPWYGGLAPDGLSSWQTFGAAGLRFLVIDLAWYPSAEVLAWARGVVEAHPGFAAIVATHDYLGWGRARDAAGEAIWRGLVRDECSIFLVVSGHIHTAAQRSDLNSCGLPVVQALADYQSVGHGGDGFMRLFRFRPRLGVVEVEAFSPVSAGAPPLGEEFTFAFPWAAGALPSRLRPL